MAWAGMRHRGAATVDYEIRPEQIWEKRMHTIPHFVTAALATSFHSLPDSVQGVVCLPQGRASTAVELAPLPTAHTAHPGGFWRQISIRKWTENIRGLFTMSERNGRRCSAGPHRYLDSLT